VLTLYGTRLALPFSDHPFSIGSVFFVDPAVTTPWLVGVLVAVVSSRQAATLRANRIGLAVGALYLGWTVAAQHFVLLQARASLAAAGIVAERTLATPTAFNTLLWRVVAIDGNTMHEGC
jgi:inner membrane protein